MKTANLTTDGIYAYCKGSYHSTFPVLLLDTTTWTQREKSKYWDGSDKLTSKRTVRRTGGRAGIQSGFGHEYWLIGLPVILPSVWDYHFSSKVMDDKDRIVDSPADLLKKAAEQMRIRDIVAEDHDGRFTEDIKKKTTVLANTADGGTRKVDFELKLVRPQAILSPWDQYVAETEQGRIAQEAAAKEAAERKAESDWQARSIAQRLDHLLGEAVNHNPSGERYDCHRKWTSSGTSSTYEVDGAVLERLLALAEKGAQA